MRAVACTFVTPNPRRALGHTDASVVAYDGYMTATTVAEFFAQGGLPDQLKYHVWAGHCTLNSAALDAAWRYFAAPKPKKRRRER